MHYLNTVPLLSPLQTGLPMTAMAVVGAQFKLSSTDRQLLQSVYLPWALRAGLRSADLMCIRYEDHFGEELEELRRRWRISVAPTPPPHLAPNGQRAAGSGGGGGAGGGARPQ